MPEIRTCPDCEGNGKLWLPPHMRKHFEYIPVFGNDTSQTGLRKIELPEWQPCALCKGQGKVECRPARQAAAQHPRPGDVLVVAYPQTTTVRMVLDVEGGCVTYCQISNGVAGKPLKMPVAEWRRWAADATVEAKGA